MTPDELWNLEPKEFNKWRRENDLKSLFNLFQEKFPLFSEWLLEYNLTVDIILDTDKPGLFIGEKGEYIILKPEHSDIQCFVQNKITQDFLTKSKIRAYSNMQTISIFTPYIQWIKTKVANKNIIELRKDLKIDDLLFSEIGLNNPETFNAKIAPGHEVLYLGNVKITNDKLSGRNLDFTNLSYIEITGKDFSDFEPKSIYYSICFHSKISKSTIYNLHFHKCEFEDFRMSDSNFYSLCFYNCQLWTTSFNDCRLEDAIFSKTGLDNVSFYGVVTNNLFYTPKKTKWPKGQSYLLSNISKDFRTLKTLFQQNGNQKAASEAYYKEKKFKLKANINSINLISPFKNGKKYGFKVFQNSLKNQMINLKSLLLDGTSYMLWGFGEKPIRTLFASSIILVLYTFLYYFSSIDSIGGELINSFYLSTTMFTTLGFGDFSPFQSGSFKFLLTSEALLGIFIFGLFVAGYANKSKY